MECARCGLGCRRQLSLGNRHRLRPVNLRLLRRIVQDLLQEVWPEGNLDLGVYVVTASEITRLNEVFLRHRGSTDVITFDYAEQDVPATRRHKLPAVLRGEIFVCADEALTQARRFHTTWQSELVRYIVHGVLHLLGYADRNAQVRRRMKREEDALLGRLAGRFGFQRLSAAK